MIAIADSGTTKTAWLFVDKKNNKTYTYRSIGFNPYYQTPDDIYSNLVNGLIPNLEFSHERVEKIYLYGAGCELEEKRAEVASGIKRAFPKTEVFVYHDLLAAARALFGDSEGIACISGTGSNTCYYDGKYIVKNVHSLGLFLGDEGSGGYLGKLLIRDYIRKQLPEHLNEAFEKKYTDRTPEILDAIYIKPFPSRYLASYSVFLSENIQDPYVQALVYRSFDELFENCITKYERYQTLDIGFIGSIAHFFKDILNKVAHDRGLKISKIIRNPLEDLAQYHFKKGI